jgi:sulfate adenylyltransferase
VNASGNPPTLAIGGGRLDALELVLSGLVTPIDGFCLPEQKPHEWPFESLLEVPDSVAAAAVSSGRLVLTDPDGTPLAGLGVAAIAPSRPGHTYLAGPLSPLQPAEHPPARDIRLTAGEPLPPTVAIFAGEPDPADVALAVARSAGRPLLFLAVSWNTEHADYRISAAVETLRRCSEQVPGSAVRFLALAPLNPAAEGAATLGHVLAVLGAASVLDFSDRSFSTPAASSASDAARPGFVVLLTGLSGSGKSTIARALSERLAAEGVYRTVLLDGDDVRRALSPDLGFSMSDRDENIRRIGWVAAKIASVGGIAICAPIAPFERTRREVRAMASASGRFILVHVATPLEVCEQRDRKGLYARARAGDLTEFTGIDSPYETPADPDLVIDTSSGSTEQHVGSILRLLG